MSFIEHYNEFCSGNESPKIYHRYAALSVLSAIVGRKIWVDQGIYTIYPNLYVIFVGEPGNGKSVAMQLAKRMVRSFDHLQVAPSSITREKITEFMGKTDSICQQMFTIDSKLQTFTQLSFFANELVTLLGANAIAMVQFFTDIYDEEEFEVATKHQGCDNIKAPYITLLGCMTPEITSSLLKMQVISSGFARRCIFINSYERGEPHPRPTITPAQRAAWDACLAWGHKIKNLSGQFKWTTEAEVFFDEWYCKKHELLKNHGDLVTKGYIRTKDVLLLKVAMLLSVARTTERILTRELLVEGLDLLDSIEGKLSRVFDGTGRNPIADLTSRMITILEVAGKAVPVKQLRADLHAFGQRQEFDDAVLQLKTTDKIQEVLINGTIPGLRLPPLIQTDSSKTV